MRALVTFPAEESGTIVLTFVTKFAICDGLAMLAAGALDAFVNELAMLAAGALGAFGKELAMLAAGARDAFEEQRAMNTPAAIINLHVFL